MEVVQTMFRSMMEPPTTGTVTPVINPTAMMMAITLDLMVPMLALPLIMVQIFLPPTLEPSLAQTLLQ